MLSVKREKSPISITTVERVLLRHDCLHKYVTPARGSRLEARGRAFVDGGGSGSENECIVYETKQKGHSQEPASQNGVRMEVGGFGREGGESVADEAHGTVTGRRARMRRAQTLALHSSAPNRGVINRRRALMTSQPPRGSPVL